MRIAYLALTLVLLAPVPLHAQFFFDPKPPDQEVEVGPDERASKGAGFETIQTGDWPGEERTKMVHEHFVQPLAKEEGASQIGLTDYALADVTGDGFADLVLYPRIVDSRKTFSGPSDGPRVLVYVFDGENWHRALDAHALEVGRKTTILADGKEQHELALIHDKGFDRYVWDGKSFVRAN